jgi:hypothetical protein
MYLRSSLTNSSTEANLFLQWNSFFNVLKKLSATALSHLGPAGLGFAQSEFWKRKERVRLEREGKGAIGKGRKARVALKEKAGKQSKSIN